MGLFRVLALLVGLAVLSGAAAAAPFHPNQSIGAEDQQLHVIKTGSKSTKASTKKAAKKKVTKKKVAKKSAKPAKKAAKKVVKKTTKTKAKKSAKSSKRKGKYVAGYKSCGKLKYRDKKTKKCVSAVNKKA